MHSSAFGLFALLALFLLASAQIAPDAVPVAYKTIWTQCDVTLKTGIGENPLPLYYDQCYVDGNFGVKYTSCSGNTVYVMLFANSITCAGTGFAAQAYANTCSGAADGAVKFTCGHPTLPPPPPPTAAPITPIALAPIGEPMAPISVPLAPFTAPLAPFEEPSFLTPSSSPPPSETIPFGGETSPVSIPIETPTETPTFTPVDAPETIPIEEPQTVPFAPIEPPTESPSTVPTSTPINDTNPIEEPIAVPSTASSTIAATPLCTTIIATLFVLLHL